MLSITCRVSYGRFGRPTGLAILFELLNLPVEVVAYLGQLYEFLLLAPESALQVNYFLIPSGEYALVVLLLLFVVVRYFDKHNGELGELPIGFAVPLQVLHYFIEVVAGLSEAAI